MLTTLALAYTGPIIIAPAMNPSMYLHEPVQEALKTLAERGAIIIEPKEGDVACGEHGQGKLAATPHIVEEVLAVAARSQLLKGKHVLITSGPTQEPIDEVRYLTNRSSGRMGAALARAALLMGARVTVVTGPTSVPVPLAATVVRVHTAIEMLEACNEPAKTTDWIIGAAAVADFRPKLRAPGKIRRGESPGHIDLVENPDVIGSLAKIVKPGARVVGFAAEPTSETETAKEKIARKSLWAIAMNDISRKDVGFESGDNELTLIDSSGDMVHSGKRTKLACALWLLEQLASK
jgi:phosphopantothenoylcysteine decarboxylase/phosphopantothenate--cysteine ligase